MSTNPFTKKQKLEELKKQMEELEKEPEASGYDEIKYAIETLNKRQMLNIFISSFAVIILLLFLVWLTTG